MLHSVTRRVRNCLTMTRVTGPTSSRDGGSVTEDNATIGVVIVSHWIPLEIAVILVVIFVCSCCSVVTVVAGLHTERIADTNSWHVLLGIVRSSHSPGWRGRHLVPGRCPGHGQPRWMHQPPAACAGLTGLAAVRDV